MPDQAPEEAPDPDRPGDLPPGAQNGDDVTIDAEFDANFAPNRVATPRTYRIRIGDQEYEPPEGFTVTRTLGDPPGWQTISWGPGTLSAANTANVQWVGNIGTSATTYAIPVYTSTDLARLRAHYIDPITGRTHEQIYRGRAMVPDSAQAAMDANLGRHRRQERERQAGLREQMDRGRARAQSLLDRFLTEQQRADWDIHRYFEIIGSCGTVFRIRPGTSGNVEVMSPSHPQEHMAKICAHPSGALPAADVHLAQMLALMTDEQAFVAKANCHQGLRVQYRDGRVVDSLADTWRDDAVAEQTPLIRVDHHIAA